MSAQAKDVTLADRWSPEAPDALMSGVQAIVRALLDQRRDDESDAIRSGGFASGYPGSPLGGLDIELQRRSAELQALGIVFQPGLNEELAATAVWGSQLAHRQRGAHVDGVLGLWFGKSPGLDRAADALRHANHCGVGAASGAVAVVGDDPACKSSTLPSACERTLSGLAMPVLAPSSVQDVLDLGRHALRLSRASGLWCALKVAADVADASATVVHRGHWAPAQRLVEHTPTAKLLGAVALAAERSLMELRLPACQAYAREHDLNPTVVRGEHDEVGLIAAGATYAELARALRELHLDEPALRNLGVRLMKIGMPWPLDGEAVRGFARGLRTVFVVEDKLALLETEVRAALYRTDAPPSVLGKHDERGVPLLAMHGALRAEQIALALGRVLKGRLGSHAVAAQRLRQLSQTPAPEAPLPLSRTPFFCSGCPHSTSTAASADTLVGAGIGCHVMLVQESKSEAADDLEVRAGGLQGRTGGLEVRAGGLEARPGDPDVSTGAGGRAGEIVGLTQMGGEGSQWIGISPFVAGEHFTQNLGDGTFHHSGSLALRAAIAAKVDITYKLLYNGTVAMTGGQPVQGVMSVAALTRMLKAEGVARIVVTTDDPRRYRRLGMGRAGRWLGRAALAPGTKVYDRARLPEVERELRSVRGVTVIVHDQACAAERRRLRRRGRLPQPAERVWINERVCEGCGDCGQKSGCLSVEPVQTELGRKTRIHQASCNVDMSCLGGDCPSFVTVEVRATQGAPEPLHPPVELPYPRGWSGPAPPTDIGARPCAVRMVGIGGTGVVTAAQVLAMAAHVQGTPVAALDQTGISQKGGPVVSDVRLGEPAALRATPRAACGSVDVLLGFDLLGAADPRFTEACDPGRTIAVVCDAQVPTGEMALHAEVPFPERSLLLGRIERAVCSIPAIADTRLVAERALGEDIAANMVLLGAAWQLGALPVSLDALRRAVKLNGAAADQNLIALGWGRAIVAAPEAVRDLVGVADTPAAPGAKALARVAARKLPIEVQELAARRFEDLCAYGGRRLAERYLDQIERVAAAEGQRAPGHDELTSAVARQLYKLLAYKDEYEVARLHLLPRERERREREFGPGARWWLHLHPPLLRALGLSRKIKLGRRWLPLLYALRGARRLRGTPLDVFGHSHLRRIEHALPGEYMALLGQALELLNEANHAQVVAIGEQAEQIRGYEQIKLNNVERWRLMSASRLEQLRLSTGADGQP